VTAQCLACAGALRPWGARLGYTYKACAACGSLQQDPMPTPEAIERLYRHEYVEAGGFNLDTATLHGPVYARILDVLGAPRPGLVVDYGCGWGGLCQLLADHHHEYVGVDFSETEIASCRERLLNCRTGDLRTLAGEGVAAHTVVAVFVFEHLLDYGAFFRQCDQLLGPGGQILLVIPTSPLVRILGRLWRLLKPGADMPQFGECISPPWHTVIFSPAGLRRLAQANGYEVARVLPCPKYPGATPLVNGIKRALAWTERAGLRLCGERWPVMTANLFVLRKA